METRLYRDPSPQNKGLKPPIFRGEKQAREFLELGGGNSVSGAAVRRELRI